MKIDRATIATARPATAPAVAPPDPAPPPPHAKNAAPPPHLPQPATARTLALHFGLPLLLALLLTLPALWPRAPFALDVGLPGDRLFLAHVHGDERLAEYSYRWTGQGAQPTLLTVPGWGAVRRARVTLRAQALSPVELRLLTNGQPIGTIAVGVTMAEQTVEVAFPPDGAGTALTLALDAPLTRVAGDSRPLGVKLDTLRLTPVELERAGAGYWRGLWPHLPGALALVAALLLLIGGSGARAAVAGRVGVALAVPLTLALALPWALAALPAALGAAGIALAVRQRARLLDGLATAWATLDRPRVAGWVMAGGIALYVAVVLPHLLAVPWINHADYADNAVVAHNLVRGNGFTVDYVAQFYRDWPTLRHPADTWPPLQPLLIALSFALFGVSVAAAKLPNLLIMVGLLVLLYRVGASLWSPRVGLLAALILALNPALFDGVIYPLNDTAFTLLAFGCVVLLTESSVEDRREPLRGSATTQPLTPYALRLTTLLGLLAGLLVLSKPSGALLLAGGGAWAVWRGWRAGALRATLVGGTLAAAVALAVWLPWGVRNQLTFGVPFYSTEAHDAWILEFRDWENIYTVYAGRRELPHPRLLVGYGFDAVTGKIAQQFKEVWTDLQEGAILPWPMLPLALLGVWTARDRRQRALVATLAAASILYTLFILGYWHYERRYTLFLLPWGALLGAAGLWWAHDRLAEARSRALAGLATLAILGLLLAPQWAALRDAWPADLRTPNSVIMAEWVRDNTPGGTVVMTRNPWEFSFHSERQSVMIPYDDIATIETIAARYGATYLQLDNLKRRDTQRPDLAPLYVGPDEWRGFRKVYDRRGDNGEGLLIYTFPAPGRQP